MNKNFSPGSVPNKTVSKRVWVFANNNKMITLSLLMILIFPFVYSYMRTFAVLTLFMIANIALSLLLRPVKKFPHGIEIVLFTTVVVSYTFGFKFGLFYGMLSILISYIAMRRLSYFILTYVPSYALVALLAASPLKIDIITLGMICTVMYNILSCILVVMFFRAKLYKCIFFAVTNIMFNYFLFTTFGSLIIHLLG